MAREEAVSSIEAIAWLEVLVAAGVCTVFGVAELTALLRARARRARLPRAKVRR
jgi:hypothetical protein